MSSTDHPSVLRFDNFEMDADSGELRKDGVRLRLPQQPFKVLHVLARRPGQVITRQQIEREIWGDATHVDFESGLNYCIKQIRSALDDDANSPRYIETLPKRGYRFVARIVHQKAPAPPARSRPILFVLPFGHLSGPESDNYFTDGLTEELIAQLGRLNPSELGVIAFTTARQYRNTEKGIDHIGRELGVQFILEGSVRRAPDRVRITAQLIQVSDQSHLWAGAYNRTLDDVIGIQIDVAERVAQALTLEIFAPNKLSMERAATRNSAAYETYLKGRYHLSRRASADEFTKAIRYFKEAIEHDPNYVLAHLGLADVYAIAGLYSNLPSREAYSAAMEHLQKALALDGNVAEAQYSMAYAKALYERDFAGAEQLFERALASNPNYVAGLYWYALCLAASGRFDRALAHIDIARQLDPMSLVTNANKGWILYLARRYDEAETQLLATLDMERTFGVARYFLGLVYLQQGRYRDAAAEFERARELSDNHPASISGMIVAAARGGDKKEARQLLKKLEEFSRSRYISPYYTAIAHEALGEKDRALTCLKAASDEGAAFLINIECDPGLDPLRAEPQFTTILKQTLKR